MGWKNGENPWIGWRNIPETIDFRSKHWFFFLWNCLFFWWNFMDWWIWPLKVKFLHWWSNTGCSLITGCWATLFSGKTHVSNTQRAQVDYYHGANGSAQTLRASHMALSELLATPKPNGLGVSSCFLGKIAILFFLYTNGNMWWFPEMDPQL